MNENLERRKALMLDVTEKEYGERPRSWWQGKSPQYETTQHAGYGKISFRPMSEEIIIRYDLKRALYGSALFFIITCCFMFLPGIIQGTFDAGWVFPMVVAGVFIFWSILKEIKHKPKIILNHSGFWIHSHPQTILWEYIVATYIKKDDSGESTSYYLVVHFYDQSKDEFQVREIVIDGLDTKWEELAADIECYKSASLTKR